MNSGLLKLNRHCSAVRTALVLPVFPGSFNGNVQFQSRVQPSLSSTLIARKLTEVYTSES
jgi:hypothetical protein